MIKPFLPKLLLLIGFYHADRNSSCFSLLISQVIVVCVSVSVGVPQCMYNSWGMTLRILFVMKYIMAREYLVGLEELRHATGLA